MIPNPFRSAFEVARYPMLFETSRIVPHLNKYLLSGNRPHNHIRTMALAKTDPSVWDPKYPVTKNQNPSKITRAEILAMLQSGAEIGKDLLLIDLRREDLEVRQPSKQDSETDAHVLRGGPSKVRSISQHKRCTQASPPSIQWSLRRMLNLWSGTAVGGPSLWAYMVSLTSLAVRILATSWTACSCLVSRLHRVEERTVDAKPCFSWRDQRLGNGWAKLHGAYGGLFARALEMSRSCGSRAEEHETWTPSLWLHHMIHGNLKGTEFQVAWAADISSYCRTGRSEYMHPQS